MNVRLPRLLIGCLLGLASQSTLWAQEVNSKITSIFIYNFAKQIEWPAQAETGDFVIGVFGHSPVAEELRNSASKIKIRNHAVIVRQIDHTEQAADIKSCHILFVAQNQSKAIKELTRIINTAPVLLVTASSGKPQSVINLFLDEEEDKVKFELNKAFLEKLGLKATANLLTLAVLL